MGDKERFRNTLKRLKSGSNIARYNNNLYFNTE